MKQIISKSGIASMLCGAAFILGQLLTGTAWAEDSAAIADLNAKVAALEREVAQVADSAGGRSVFAGIPVHGFADVGYTRASNNDTRLDQAGHGFWANSLDFYLTPQFSDRSKALIELIFEFLPDGLATDLERLQLGYTFSDQLTTWLGRFHAPYGYWNTGFHHGAQIQTAITRPRFIDFEDKGGLLPAHVMGAWATGAFPMGESKLTYDLFVGNGNAIVDVDTTAPPVVTRGFLTINNARDSNSNNLVGLNVGYKMGGLVVGAHGFSQRVNVIDAGVDMGDRVSVKMTGLYGAYEDDDWEAIAEYYRFKNEDLITVTPGVTESNTSWLGFAQVGHAVGADWMPYVRAEEGSLDQDDPYFNLQAYGYSYSRQVLGVKYMLNPRAALKLEANRTKEGDGVPLTGADNGKYTEARIQYAINF